MSATRLRVSSLILSTVSIPLHHSVGHSPPVAKKAISLGGDSGIGEDQSDPVFTENAFIRI